MDGLNSPSFRAKLQGQQVKVSSATARPGSRRVVLLLDASGSVNKKLNFARLIAENLLHNDPQELHTALVVFSDHIIDTADFSRPPSEIATKLTSVKEGWGKTALLDALMYSATLLQPSMPGDAVYVISDGFDNSSHAILSEVNREFLTRRIRLFAFKLADSLPIGWKAEDDSLLQELARTTGGSVVEFDGGEQRDRLIKALASEFDEIVHFYDLEVELPNRLNKEHRWDLQVLDDNGKRRNDVQVFYPQKLLPCLVGRE